jgi:hypothetical protein
MTEFNEHVSLREWMEANYDKSELCDIVEHGCQSGCAFGLVYYSETGECYEAFEDNLWDILEVHADDMGYKHPLELLSGLKGAEHVHGDDQFKNLVVWFAVEVLANAILRDWEEDE